MARTLLGGWVAGWGCHVVAAVVVMVGGGGGWVAAWQYACVSGWVARRVAAAKKRFPLFLPQDMTLAMGLGAKHRDGDGEDLMCYQRVALERSRPGRSLSRVGQESERSGDPRQNIHAVAIPPFSAK